MRARRIPGRPEEEIKMAEVFKLKSKRERAIEAIAETLGDIPPERFRPWAKGLKPFPIEDTFDIVEADGSTTIVDD
jgi:hypothetical protein